MSKMRPKRILNTSELMTEMNVKWQKVKLCDLCSSISDGDHLAPPKSDIGVPFVTISDIRDNHFDLSDTRFVPEAYYQKIDEKRKVHKGDVLYSVVGSYGIPVFAASDLKIAFQRHIAILRPGEKLVPKFLYYSLKNPTFYKKADGAAIGAAQKTISLSALRRLEIDIPPLPTQKRIADILSAYDDLIENNRRRMEILEQSARLIYRKMFGTNKKRTNLLHLEDFVERTISGDWGKESPDRKCTEKIMCLRGADIPSLRYRDFGKGIVRFVTPQHVEERAMKDGDLFVEMSGGSPTQATGRVGLVSSRLLRDAALPVLCTNFCRVIRPKPGHAFFLYLAWLDLYDQDLMFMFEHSAIALKNFDLDLFLKKILVVKPEDSQLWDFNEKIAGVMDQMDVLGGENRRLIKARDILLPKLMNGELGDEKVEEE